VPAFARIRILSSIDQARFGRFAAMTGRLLASCNHRESVAFSPRCSTAQASGNYLTPAVTQKSYSIVALVLLI
jgi:hypothetical protein